MIAIPVSGAAVRRTLRTLIVVVVACTAIAIDFSRILFSANNPSLLEWVWFDFRTAANVVIEAGLDPHAAGISTGDRIDYSLMRPDERYGDPEDGLRPPDTDKNTSFVVERHGKRHVATVWTYSGFQRNPYVVGSIAQEAVFLVAVLLASGLLLIKPAPLSLAFFLYAVGSGSVPLAFRFLPPSGYAAIMAVSDTLAALGAIGFLLLALYIDPGRRLRPRLVVGASALLLVVIVVPIAASDAFELLLGTRPAWPLAGWVSFSAVVFCYVAGFVLLLAVAARTAASRSLRLLAAYFATAGALQILDMVHWGLLAPWYSANLPGVVMTGRIFATSFPTFLQLPSWEIAARLGAALAISYALLQGGFFVTRPAFVRFAACAGLTIAIAGVFLHDVLIHGNHAREAFQIASALGWLLAFYLIINARVADTGPIFGRIVAYVIVALLVVAVLAVANIALMRQFDKYAPIIPLEIFAAIAIGYWVSGLRDLATCLSLACVDAWNAWAKGNARGERDALTHSLGLAERTRRRGTIAEVRGQMAFSAWRDGEDGAFEQSADALRSVLGGRNVRGIRGFAHAATSDDGELRFEEDDLPEWRSRAALVLCARTNDAGRAQQLAIDALESAEHAGLPSLQVLGSIAVAETCPEQRNTALERAHAIARDAGWPALSKSILALRANSRDIGILQSFVDVRLRKSRPARPMFEVSFFNAELCQNGSRVSLSEKQLELLLTVASMQTGISDNDLIDALWPESEGDAARNSFRVCLHGLRKNAGDARIVTRIGKGYVAHPWADVDLWRFQSLLAKCRESGGREGAPELRGLCDALRTGQGRRATLGDWFYRFEQLLQRKFDEAERVLDRETARSAQT